MLAESSSVPSGSTLQADVCIVGCGPAGITLARELTRARLHVLVLEAGARQPTFGGVGAAGTSGGYVPIEQTRASGLAGTSALWLRPNSWSPDGGLRSRRLDASDFEARSWLPGSGWPFGPMEMHAYYERAEQLCGIGPPIDLGDAPARPPLALDRSRVETTLFCFGPAERFRDEVDELAVSALTTVLLRARVVEIETSAGATMVTGVRVRGEAGVFTVRSRIFVLAAGGIENARLLLASDRTQSGGLGNQNDLVGRYFMDHLTLTHGAIRPNDRQFFDQIGLYRRHAVHGVPALGALRLSDTVMRSEGLLGVILSPYVGSPLFLRPSYGSLAFLLYHLRRRELPREASRHLIQILTHPADVLTAAYFGLTRAHLKRQRYFGIHAHIEPSPRAENRIVLSEKRGADGQREATVEWRLGDEEERSWRRTMALVDAELHAAGIGRLVWSLSPAAFRGRLEVTHHHMGTTRMHRDPKRGVVDENGRLHGVANLYLAGSSVMPTAGAATVTLTLVALSIRLADHLTRIVRSSG